MSIIDFLIGQLAPYDCLACGSEGSLLCDSCFQKMPTALPHTLQTGTLGSVQAFTTYKGPAKDLIWKLKSNGAQAAAKLMAKHMNNRINFSSGYVIVPVPTATTRVRQRGYDQAKLLARELSRQAQVPYLDCLARRGQAHQVGANREQRLNQLTGSFRIKRPQSISGRKIILVDDVMTTGATLKAAADILKRAGASQISAITFAQA